MNTKTAAVMIRDLDVAMSIFDTLQFMLENNAHIRDFHSLSSLAGEGRRKLDGVIDVVSDL